MNYILHKRFKGMTPQGERNFRATTRFICADGIICTLNGERVCLDKSYTAHQYFARNDDGCGMQRGRLTQEIQKRLSKRDGEHQARWDKIWNDYKCQRFKKNTVDDYWLWNHDFYTAGIEELKYIARLIGLKVNEGEDDV